MDNAHLWLFFGLVFGIVILPGMDMAFVLGSALVGGRKAGLAAVAGLVAGGLCHVAIAASGLAVALTVFASAFNALLVAGALYVAWLGWGLWRSASGFPLDERQPLRAPLATFARAALTNLLNPKAYVFMLAVFPQFFRPEAGSIVAQAAVLAAIISATQAAVYGVIALAADAVRGWLHANPAASRTVARTVGVVLMLVAAVTVIEGWRRI
jgi:threonine/homoserine/homoserine lactone efflux protein